MVYFLTVKSRQGFLLHDCEKCDTLDAALEIVSANYLTDCSVPFWWSGYFALRSGENTRLYLTRRTAGFYLRGDIELIEILSERGLLEVRTYGAAPSD